MNPTLAAFILSRPEGLLDSADVQTLVQLDQWCPVVVECAAGAQFTAPARDIAHFIALIERDDRERVDSVRITIQKQAEAKIARDLERGLSLLAAALPPRVIHDRAMFTEPTAAPATRCAIRFNEAGL